MWDASEADVSWMAALMDQRRVEYEMYSPVFWRRRADARTLHEAFLGYQITNPDAMAVRCEHGFAIGTPNSGHCYIDDFAVQDRRWSDVGAQLALEIWKRAEERGLSAVRCVTARLDEPKVAMLSALGLQPWQQWWCKPIAGTAGSEFAGAIDGDGFSIQRSAAPPVYDPGGPVGLLTIFDGAQGIGWAEVAAAADGMVLLVAPVDVGDPREVHLVDAGFQVASQFFVGIPTASTTTSA